MPVFLLPSYRAFILEKPILFSLSRLILDNYAESSMVLNGILMSLLYILVLLAFFISKKAARLIFYFKSSQIFFVIRNRIGLGFSAVKLLFPFIDIFLSGFSSE
jgi:hypothetical protein